MFNPFENFSCNLFAQLSTSIYHKFCKAFTKFCFQSFISLVSITLCYLTSNLSLFITTLSSQKYFGNILYGAIVSLFLWPRNNIIV